VCEGEYFSADESWVSTERSAATPESSREFSRPLALQGKNMIERALRESRGQVYGPSGAAARLGMPRSTLESRIRSFKIDKYRFWAPRAANGEMILR
jgi:formate hydrogenlyase transcriptional activator